MAISLMAAVGYGWIVDREVSVVNHYYNTVTPNVAKKMYVGVTAGTSATVIATGEYLGGGSEFWTSFVQANGTNGQSACNGELPPSTSAVMSYQLHTHLSVAGTSASHGYAWQSPDVAPFYCPNGNQN